MILRKPIVVFALIFGMAGLALSACQGAGGSGPAQATASPALEPTQTIPPSEIPAQTVTLTDGLGRAVMLQIPAQRIVSLAPSNTEILYAIGAGPRVVGRDEFSDFPAEAQLVTDIGGGFGDIDLERLVSLEPDLVLSADIIAPEQIQSLENLGLTVYALPNPTDFEALYKNLRTVARLVGREEAASELIESLSARVKNVEEKTSSVEDRLAVFYVLDTTDPNAPWTSGPGTFVDLLITKAGGTNLGASMGGAWVQMSLENLISEDPDIILLGNFTWGGVKPEDVKAWPGWDQLTAVKEGRVFTFDDNLVSRPGPRLVDGLEAMAKLLHPEAFE